MYRWLNCKRRLSTVNVGTITRGSSLALPLSPNCTLSTGTEELKTSQMLRAVGCATLATSVLRALLCPAFSVVMPGITVLSGPQSRWKTAPEDYTLPEDSSPTGLATRSASAHCTPGYSCNLYERPPPSYARARAHTLRRPLHVVYFESRRW